MADKHILPRFAEAASILFRGKTWNRIAVTIEGFKPLAGDGIRLECTPTGTLIHAIAGESTPYAPYVPTCPFGSIITWLDGTTQKTGIAGGIIIAGPKTWDIPPKEVSLTSNINKLVYVRVDVEVNQDNEREVILPGIKDSSWTPTWLLGDTYPDGTIPSVGSGNGTIILPVGRLRVQDGIATLSPTGCENFHIGSCGMSLYFARTFNYMP